MTALGRVPSESAVALNIDVKDRDPVALNILPAAVVVSYDNE